MTTVARGITENKHIGEEPVRFLGLVQRQNEQLHTLSEELRARNEELQAQSEEIRRQQEELRRAYDELETRVEERTRELAQTNEELKIEIAQRQHSEGFRERLTAILEATSDLVGIADGDGHVLYINGAGRRMVRVGEGEDTSNTSIPDFLPEWAQALVLVEGLPAALRDGIWSRETALLSRDGREIPVSQVILAHKAPDGTLEFFSTIARDITERKRAEEDLQESFKALEKALEGTIQAMALTAAMRDPYTAGHQQRMAELACAIAKEMGLSDDQTRVIRLAAAVHDIGKTNVPAEILSKPGRLGEIEFALIKGHSQSGYDILKRIEFPWPIADIVLQHHERMDGSGYPFGLTGEEILPEARILGVADVVEAMAAHRPYRPALGIEAALQEIALKRGVLYDPLVVDTCRKLFTEKGFNWQQ